MRLARESVIHDQIEESVDLDSLIVETDEDKSFAAMSVAKTIGTVRCHSLLIFDEYLLRPVGFFSIDCFLH